MKTLLLIVLALVISTTGLGLALVTARHDLAAERRARCLAELELERYRAWSRDAKLAVAAIWDEAGPDWPCPQVRALRQGGR